ncbi:MAG: hypothetical protein ACYTG1_04745 [Planctomycetota bacterium]|jgi:hypothetical protein
MSSLHRIQTGAIAAAFLTTAAPADVIVYGDLAGDTVTFTAVTEYASTDPAPLYGSPGASGDELRFDTPSFDASAAGPFDVDITDGTCFTTIVADAETAISALEFEAAGVYHLTGPGGAPTAALVGSSVFIDVIAVDGASVTPVGTSFNLAMTPSGGDFNLADDGPTAATPWSGAAAVDLDALLGANGVGGRATSVTVTIGLTLGATSETDSDAGIGSAGGTGHVWIGAVTDSPPAAPEDPTTTLLRVLGAWGACPGDCPPACIGDVTGDCRVDVADLLAVLAAWGAP